MRFHYMFVDLLLWKGQVNVAGFSWVYWGFTSEFIDCNCLTEYWECTKLSFVTSEWWSLLQIEHCFIFHKLPKDDLKKVLWLKRLFSNWTISKLDLGYDNWAAYSNVFAAKKLFNPMIWSKWNSYFFSSFSPPPCAHQKIKTCGRRGKAVFFQAG